MVGTDAVTLSGAALRGTYLADVTTAGAGDLVAVTGDIDLAQLVLQLVDPLALNRVAVQLGEGDSAVRLNVDRLSAAFGGQGPTGELAGGAGRIGAASIVAPFQYTQIVWACIYGLVLFNTPIEPHLLLGAGIIVLSGWLVLRPGSARG